MRTVPLDRYTPEEYRAYVAAVEEARVLSLASRFYPPEARAAKRRAEAIDAAVAERIALEREAHEQEQLASRHRSTVRARDEEIARLRAELHRRDAQTSRDPLSSRNR